MEGPATDTESMGFWLLTALPPLLMTAVTGAGAADPAPAPLTAAWPPVMDAAACPATVAVLFGAPVNEDDARAALAAATAAARSFILSLIPGVKVILGFWLGTKCVIFTGFLPSSVKISVN